MVANIGRAGDTNRLEDLREHYLIEKELADRLRHARPEERRTLYSPLYDELYRRVVHLKVRGKAPEERAARIATQMRFLRPFLRPESVFLEVGAGTGALCCEAARYARKVYAMEVSAEVACRATPAPPNFRLLLTDGFTIPVPDGSVDLVYSHQVMEHLHPDDALDQLHEIYRILAHGGRYLCITPNRLSGPHDISACFGRVAQGFHMKEYTTFELAALLKRTGFSRVEAYMGFRGHFSRLSIGSLILAERILGTLPYPLCHTIARHLPFRMLMSDIRLAGVK